MSTCLAEVRQTEGFCGLPWHQGVLPMPYYMYHAFWTDLDLTSPRLGYLLQAVFCQDQLQEEQQGCDSIDSLDLNIAPDSSKYQNIAPIIASF